MEDVTRLSRCARCGATLPITATVALCEACDDAIASAPTVMGLPGDSVDEGDENDETRILPASGTSSGDAPTVLAGGARGPVAPKLTAGQTFGPYRVQRLLGRGGMGDVYEAEHVEHGRRVAIKVLNGALAGAEDRARFLSEGELAASITHPNTVYIFGSEEIDGAPVIVMELLSGGTLRDMVQARGPLPPAEAVDVILQVIAGLDAAARTGILHRDVKPANCFVDLQGRVKVGDFGLSISTHARQQQTGMFLGTPQFAPPEQIRGEPLDARADIYAVGGTLFYLLTGQPPFDDKDITTLVTRVTTEAPRSPREMRANVPAALAAIVTRSLAKDRQARPAGYRELEELLHPFSSAAPAPGSLGRRFVAGAIDYGLFMLLVVPITMIVLFSGSTFPRWELGLMQLPVWIAYFGALEGRWGASVGKRLVGLQVTRPNGQRAGFGRAAVRAVTYQLPGLTTIVPVLWLGPARFDQLGIEHPMFGAAMALPFFLALALLFVTARRRNGFAALQDLASDTRVVRVRQRVEQSAVDLGEDDAAIAAHFANRVGPYEVVRSLGRTERGELLLGFDPQLKRRVWLHVLPIGAPAVFPVLRDLARPARLRWLSGRRLATEAWDAYEAFDGVALTTLPAAQPWRVVRRWLLDLAQEVSAALQDDSLGMLSLDRVWITRDGRARLLDLRAPGATSSEASSSHPDFEAVETWLAAVARRGLAGPTATGAVPALPPALPLSARSLIDRLDARAFTTPEAIVADVTALLARPDQVSRVRRTASVLLPALAPVVCMLLGVVAAIGMRAVAAATPDADALAVALTYLDGVSRRTDPAAVDERRQVETYIAATYRTTLSNRTIWTNPLTGPKLMVYRPLAEEAVAHHPSVTADELAEATAALGPFVAAQQKATKDQQSRARIAPRAGTVAMLGLGLILAGGGGVCFALIFRAGLFLRVFGLAVVNGRGRQASRSHAMLRAALAWAPAAVLIYMTFASQVLFRDLAYATAHPVETAVIVAAIGLFVGGAFVASLRPARGLQDVVARTVVVPQ